MGVCESKSAKATEANGPREVDVLVLGSHPAASVFAAALRAGKRPPTVVHATLPGEADHARTVLVNPELLQLHAACKCLGKLKTVPVHGVRFVADDPKTFNEHRAVKPIAFAAPLSDLRDALAAHARAAGVEELSSPVKTLGVSRPDAAGVTATINGHFVRARAIVVAGQASADVARALGIGGWPRGVVRRYTFAELPAETSDKAQAVAMSLDLGGLLRWAWRVATPWGVHVGVAAIDGDRPEAGASALRRWAAVLQGHGLLRTNTLPVEQIRHIDLPMAGALVQDGVARRTLLIGPAGGFISACGEDVYPGCWSAIHAANILAKALRHSPKADLQDALQPYRHQWRTTLGVYLQGPQQSLRFLLPLVYRNAAITRRLTEAVLLGKSMIH